MAKSRDESEDFQEEPRPRRSRDEGIVPERPPRGPRESHEDEEEIDRPRQRRPRSAERRRDDSAVSTMIPYHNGMALTAYYLGVFGLIPVAGLVLGPLGLILGILGLRNARRDPEVKGTGHAITGIVLGGIAIVANYGCIVILVISRFASR